MQARPQSLHASQVNLLLQRLHEDFQALQQVILIDLIVASMSMGAEHCYI
jgi:hypothetical protein